jgi:hypothetical protein
MGGAVPLLELEPKGGSNIFHVVKAAELQPSFHSQVTSRVRPTENFHKAMREILARFDSDGDGRLSAEELDKYIDRCTGCKLDESESRRIQNLYMPSPSGDKDEDGAIAINYLACDEHAAAKMTPPTKFVSSACRDVAADH